MSKQISSQNSLETINFDVIFVEIDDGDVLPDLEMLYTDVCKEKMKKEGLPFLIFLFINY